MNIYKKILPIAVLALIFATGTYVGVAKADITTGLVSLWKFDETSGTTATDSAGSNTGTLTNGPTWITTGKIGGALSFDGSNDYVAATPSIGTTATFSTWATWTGANTKMMFALAPGSPGPDLFFFSGKISWNTYDSANNSFGNIPASASDGNFHHYVVVVESGNTKLYYDGALYGSATYKSPASNTLQIGGQASYQWAGKIDDFRIYNRALTPTDITELYAYTGVVAPPPPPPSSDWSFNTPGSFTWTVPAGVNQIKVQVWGAGGAGGSGKIVGGIHYPGMGGGAGSLGETTISVSSGDQFIIDIGQGGRSATNAASTQGGFTIVRKMPLTSGVAGIPDGSSSVMLQAGPGSGGVSYLKSVPTTGQDVTISLSATQTFSLPAFLTDTSVAISGGSATDCYSNNPTKLYYGSNLLRTFFHGEHGFGQIGGSINGIGGGCTPLYYLTPLIVTTQAVVDFYTNNGQASMSPWLNDIGGGSDTSGFLISGTGNIYYNGLTPTAQSGHPGGFPRYLASNTPLASSGGGNGPTGEIGGIYSSSGHGTDLNIDGASPSSGGGGAENGLGGWGGNGQVIITDVSSPINVCSVTAPSTILSPGQTFTANWTAAVGHADNDFIAIYKSTTPAIPSSSSSYQGESTQGRGWASITTDLFGTLSLVASTTPGTYELRYVQRISPGFVQCGSPSNFVVAAPPTNVTATAGTCAAGNANAVILNWLTPSYTNDLFSYNIYLGNTPSDSVYAGTPVFVGTNSYSTTTPVLVTNKSYTYGVSNVYWVQKSSDWALQETASTTASVTVLTCPVVPATCSFTNATVDSVDPKKINLSWTISNDTSSYTYTLKRNSVPISSGFSPSSTGSSDTGLSPETYTYTLTSSAPSTPATCTSPAVTINSPIAATLKMWIKNPLDSNDDSKTSINIKAGQSATVKWEGTGIDTSTCNGYIGKSIPFSTIHPIASPYNTGNLNKGVYTFKLSCIDLNSNPQVYFSAKAGRTTGDKLKINVVTSSIQEF